MPHSRLAQVAAKWSALPIPAGAQSILSEASSPLIQFLAQLFQKWTPGSTLTPSQADELSAKIGDLLGDVTIAAYFVGLEFAPPRSTADLSSDIPILNIALDFDEWVVLDNGLEAARQSIVKKTALAKQSLTRQEDDVVRRIDDVRKAIESNVMNALGEIPRHKIERLFASHSAFMHMPSSVVVGVDQAILESLVSDISKDHPRPGSTGAA